VLARQRTVLWMALLVSVISALVGLPPEVDSNLLNLLPDSEPSVAAIRRINEQEGGLNLLTLSYRHEDPERLDNFLDGLEQDFLEMEEVDFAMHELDPDLGRLIALMQFEAREIEELNLRLQGALALGSVLNPVVTQRLMDMGPLTERIAKSDGLGLFEENSSEAKLIVRPITMASDPAFVIPFMAKVDQVLEAAHLAEPDVELVWMGGAYRHTREDVQGIQSDLLVTGIASASLVMMVIIIAFRSWRAVLFVFPPLVVANLMNLAFVRFYLGPMNTYTSLGTAILLGLGIDFVVHLVGRYREYRLEGQSLEDAVVAAWIRTGPPCLTAAATSAAGFLALATADFRGFAQLGVLLAVGLLLCLVWMLVLLPVLLSRFDTDPRPLIGTGRVDTVTSRSSYRWSPLGLGLTLAVTILAGAFVLPNMQFEYDMSALRRDGMSYVELSEEERALARESYSPVIASFDDYEQMVRSQRMIEDRVAAGEMPHVGGVVSIANVLPDDQPLRLEGIKKLVSLMEHRNLRYMPRVLIERLLPLRGLEVRTLTRDDLPIAVKHILGAGNPNIDRMLLMPKGNMWDVREAKELSKEVYGALPGTEVAGEYLGVSAMFLIALRDGPKITLVALFFVFLLSWWDLRRIHWVAGVVGALVTGMIWAGSALCLTGVKMTMVNLAGIPILLGIGVDVVIHLAHRLREEGPGGIRRALMTTGVAAGISTVTTICSFASLSFAGNRGVRSLGMVVVIGLTVVALVSALTLPLMWSAGWKISGKAPSEQARDDETV
jgi:hypothetical protein